MDAITVLDDVVNQLADSFRRAESVNYQYKACRKIVEAKIAETEEFDFGRMQTWLDEIKTRCYTGKYKCIKRIVYGLNAYLNRREVGSAIRSVYPNDNSQFKKISKASQQMISNLPKSSPYIRKHQIDNIPSWSKPMVDKYLAYRRNLGYRASTINMDCTSIYRFITNISDLGIDDYPSIRSEHVLSFGAPNAEAGIPGDFYFDIENLVRYQKKASGWSVLVDFNDSLTRKYNVEFKTNGGQFASSTFTGTTTIERGHCFYADGRQVPLVVRQGFIFDGWYTTKNPDPTIHGRFTDLTNVYSDRTLYANWIQDTASK
ncbi:MAG: InlB B-repeat-containing protein [Candidatus Enterosoma sp.]|nr:InlB B-repeat-containing protein [Candidatus Enterosoma sp.]